MSVVVLIRRHALYLAWLVALVATAGSLVFSEVLGYIPCQLCWFQRICMYPQALLLGLASYHDDRRIATYLIPLSAIGLAIAVFHYLEQKVPGFGLPGLCQVGVPCSGQYINWWGFVTIPFLSLTAFALILSLLWAKRRDTGEEAL